MRSFEKALKMENGERYMGYDERNVYGVQMAYPQSKLPEYQTKFSAGADFFCAEEVVIPSVWKQAFNCLLSTASNKLDSAVDYAASKLGYKKAEEEEKELVNISPTLIHTGIKASMEENEVLKLYNRSSNPKKLGLVLANGVGVVDADYYENKDNDGEIMFAFYNFKLWSVTIKVGDRIGQGVFESFLRPTKGLCIKEDIREGGFGSSDKN